MDQPILKLNSENLSGQIIVDIVAAESEILASNARQSHCSSCDQVFHDYGALQAHEFLQHGKRQVSNVQWTTDISHPVSCAQQIRYYCPVEKCRFSLPTLKGAGGSVEKCNGKQKRFFSEMRYLKEHFRRHHSETVFKCKVCDMKCRTEKELSLHENSCQANVCVCGKTVKTRTGFLKHRKKCSKALVAGYACKKTRRTKIHDPTDAQFGSPLRVKSILPKLPKQTWITAPAVKYYKTSGTLSINSCIQTTETLLRRPKNMHTSTDWRSINSWCTPSSDKVSQQIQTGGDDFLSDVRSSCGAQTNALLHKSNAALQIDVYTQTDLLSDSDGFSTQEASALFQLLESSESYRSCQGIETQTVESELAPYYFPSSTTETQTFEEFCNFGSGSTSGMATGVMSPGLALTETLGTQTTVYMDGLIDQFVLQESVDMQTQTLENLDSCFVWEFTDADTQTSNLRDFLGIADF